MKIQKNIIFPIFIECSNFIEDTFWKKIFEDLAYGLTTNLYGVSFVKNTLSCNFKNKEFNYIIKPELGAEVIFKEVFFLLKEKRGILSTNDKKNRSNNFKNIENNLKNQKFLYWSSVKFCN